MTSTVIIKKHKKTKKTIFQLCYSLTNMVEVAM